ncbi:NTF2-like protein [Fomitiporia mediterranea MF3/22]|uniref:NTF2-like protein n=1 Tax=Fomitiporia mediterranea (strain MF3/22) TaxID=694068 RepID=UPI000440818C|nr:NTF2-like protein [Fomitiporia mediterranea MF3/22]EJD03827.1 NTF2-like protein [Fomitiporia mediterranea MF3/22]
MAGLANSDIDIATRGADQFVYVYYAAYDSKDRIQSVPKFYRQTSSVVWNGNPVQGDTGVRELMEKIPPSKHEIQSFDCHPIPNTSPPSLLVTVSGTVVHGRAAVALTHPTASKSVDDQPRIFAQTFMLVPDSDNAAPGGDASSSQVKYYVLSDDMRFVG